MHLSSTVTAMTCFASFVAIRCEALGSFDSTIFLLRRCPLALSATISTDTDESLNSVPSPLAESLRFLLGGSLVWSVSTDTRFSTLERSSSERDGQVDSISPLTEQNE